MSIEYDVVTYEIAVAMRGKVGSHYVHVFSQSLIIQLGSLVDFHFQLLQCSLESHLAFQK
jgi:hypothetical protein